jgi:hypothetical protein
MKIKKTYRLHSFLKGLGRYRHQNGWESINRDLSIAGHVWVPTTLPILTVRPTGTVNINTTTTQGVESSQSIRGVQSRYAMKIINNSFYGFIGNP